MRRRLGLIARALTLATALAACNVEPLGTPTGGVTVVRQPGCPAAALVVLTDYVSSQVAISALDGETLSESFVSSASGAASSLAFPLSGDVVVASARPPSGRVVLIDRFGTNVVTWLDPETAEALGQLPVGTGFQSNPQDYLELDERRALLTRFDDNPAPGRVPFDTGGDVLVIDTRSLAITGSIGLPRDDDFPPRPAALARIDSDVVVTLQRHARDFQSAGDAVLAGIDATTLDVEWTLELGGLKNCGRLTLAPGGETALVACTGFIDREGSAENIEQSGLVILDATVRPPLEVARLSAMEVAGEPLQQDVEFFSDTGFLLKTQTAFGSGASNNRLFAFDLGTRATVELARARPGSGGGGRGVVYGGMLCTPGCGNVCLVADSDRGALRRFVIEAGTLTALPSVVVETRVGLPPRGLGSY